MTTPICPYCNSASVLVGGDAIYPHRPDLYQLKFWQCAPCDAFVGCHKLGAIADGVRSDGSLPLGRLANAELRKAKQSAHAAFDPLWHNGCFDSRRDAYKWLAQKLGISRKVCHIGMFDVTQCHMVVSHCNAFLESKLSAIGAGGVEPLRKQAAVPQGVNAPNEWEDIRTLPTCDDLIWLYCQDTNTIDGPITPEPNLEEYGWSHWAYANAPSTVWIDAAQAKKEGKKK